MNVAEPAYSYSSNTLWLGTPDSNGVIPIAGKYYVDIANNAYITAQAAFDAANNASGGSTVIAGLAFDKANSANIVASSSFDKANSANIVASAAFDKANSANIVGSSAFDKANSANIVAASAFDRANTKLSTTGGTITGDLSIVGNLSVSGNTSYINVQNYRVEDPLIYLAGNNYVSDIVDIGFIANYVNATGSNVHTGIFRDHSTKEYYVFQGYDQEPENNHIDPNGNNFTLAVLNADIRTSNLTLGGANAILWIKAAFDKSNSANIVAASAFDKANAASAQAANADFISSGILTVPFGGTGLNTIANNGVLFGNTTGAIRTAASSTEGHVLQISNQGTPTFGSLDGGSF